MRLERTIALLLASLSLVACKSGQPNPDPSADPAPAEPEVAEAEPIVPGNQIVICGQRFEIDAPVVLWSDPGGYDAYSIAIDPSKPPSRIDPADDGPNAGLRYTPGRVERGGDEAVLVPADCDEVATLATVVDQFVVHYDAAATSQRCFEVLQDERGLSVHFLIDVDGTIYQTLDCREQAWHATKANTRSIGVEMAQIGAFPPPEVKQLEKWYGHDRKGSFLKLPESWGDGGVLTEDFVARPRNPERESGVIHGRPYSQYDFTPQQYDSLQKLVSRVTRELPRIRLDVPRGADRRPTYAVMSDAEFDAFTGILGHYHVSAQKVDPGPVFDFEEFLIAVRREQAKLPYKAPAGS